MNFLVLFENNSVFSYKKKVSDVPWQRHRIIRKNEKIIDDILRIQLNKFFSTQYSLDNSRNVR